MQTIQNVACTLICVVVVKFLLGMRQRFVNQYDYPIHQVLLDHWHLYIHRNSPESPVAILAKFRLFKQRRADNCVALIRDWYTLPAWLKSELGFFFVRGPSIFELFDLCYFNLKCEYCNCVMHQYFILFRGVFVTGSLSEFIRAVKLYEATYFALYVETATEHTFINSVETFVRAFPNVPDPDRFTWKLMERYTFKKRMRVLTALLAELRKVSVQSNGVHWLAAKIRELDEMEAFENTDHIPQY